MQNIVLATVLFLSAYVYVEATGGNPSALRNLDIGDIDDPDVSLSGSSSHESRRWRPNRGGRVPYGPSSLIVEGANGKKRPAHKKQRENLFRPDGRLNPHFMQICPWFLKRLDSYEETTPRPY